MTQGEFKTVIMNEVIIEKRRIAEIESRTYSEYGEDITIKCKEARISAFEKVISLLEKYKIED